jgi:hypothetical protein
LFFERKKRRRQSESEEEKGEKGKKICFLALLTGEFSAQLFKPDS